MIPTIEQIVEDLLSGNITQHQAIEWLHEHAKNSDETLRDMFAGFAMQGMNANPELLEYVTRGSITDGSCFERMAKKAYEQADAMLSARES